MKRLIHRIKRKILSRKKTINNSKTKKYFLLFTVISIITLQIIRISKTDDKMDYEKFAFLNVSWQSILAIENLSSKYDLDFSKTLAIYIVDNNYFLDKKEFISQDEIEKNFIYKLKSKESKQNKGILNEMTKIISSIFSELKNFPITISENEEDKKYDYIYSDSFGSKRDYGGERQHLGCDIVDRENIVANIPIISMTDGKIENLGWNELGGYQVGIRTSNGNYYYYAHLDEIDKNLKIDKEIVAGTKLGLMGDTGYGKEGTSGKFPVHLHIGIMLADSKNYDNLWVNPYPILRTLDKTLES